MASRIAAEGGGIASLVLVVLLVSLSLAYVLLHRRLGRRAAALGRRLQGLETREGRMARAVKGAGLGLWEWDRQEGGLHWSDEFKAIAGLPRDQTPTWAHLESRLETSDRGALRTSLQAPTVECEFRLQTDEGPRWHLLVGRQDNDGRRASGILMDIHERRAVQAERERLLEAQALDLASAREDLMKAQMMNAVGSLAGGLAHDFNNYLQVIKGSADNLAAVHEQDEDLEAILEATGEAESLANQLLSLRDSPLYAPHRETDLGLLLRSSRAMLERVLPAGVDLEIRAPAELPSTTLGDARQLRQLVVNLIVNARDAMPDGGRIVVELREAAVTDEYGGRRRGLELSVSDQGVGMSPELQKRVFDPFFTSKPPGKGTGLGLAMVAAITRRHDGAVALESIEDNGTTVRVWLPLRSAEFEEAVPTTSDLAPRRVRVLIVDDDEGVRRSVARMLMRAGHEVFSAGGRAEAEALSDELLASIDLIICDVMLPDGLGHNVARSLRSRTGSETAVILVSGYSAPFESGDDQRTAFLSKPFSIPELTSSIQGLMASAE